MAFKRRKMLELQTFFLQIWVIIGKLKSDVSGKPKCEPIKIYYLSSLLKCCRKFCDYSIIRKRINYIVKEDKV